MTNHPHSYRFPYVVEHVAPTAYRVHHVVFSKDITSIENKKNLVIEDDSPEINGFLKPSLRKTLIKIISEWSDTTHKKMCLVFSPKECIYYEDGDLRCSTEIPSGGADIYNTFDEIPPVLEGLKQCDTCGYFYGSCVYNKKKWDISCACNPNICERCNAPVYKWKITSNHYDPVDTKCWHVPIYCAWGHICPDGEKGQLKNNFLIDPRTGENLLNRN